MRAASLNAALWLVLLGAVSVTAAVAARSLLNRPPVHGEAPSVVTPDPAERPETTRELLDRVKFDLDASRRREAAEKEAADRARREADAAERADLERRVRDLERDAEFGRSGG